MLSPLVTHKGGFCVITVLSITFFVGLHHTQFIYTSTKSNAVPVSSTMARGNLSSALNSAKRILLWENSWLKRSTGETYFVDSGCRVTNCFMTVNSSAFTENDFDAILIHPPNQRTPRKFVSRRPDQIIIMFSLEPPHYMPDMDTFDNYFNWTISYRNGSDFVLKYGEIIPVNTSPISLENKASLSRRAQTSGINPAKGKTKLVAWFVSNCDAPSNRQAYVKKLSRYIQVDIFSQNGRCGGRDACPKNRNVNFCYKMVEESYKFYLSFENEICSDYVTEKFFEMMTRSVVPVVLGGADYASIAPPHSYINALDYSPRQLAEYLIELDRNDTLYAEYFWWKPYYRVRKLTDMTRSVFCDVCEALHTQPIKRKTVTGLKKWYIDNSKCINHPKFNST